MNARKHLALLLAMTMVLAALAGCGGAGTAQTTPTEVPSAPAATPAPTTDAMAATEVPETVPVEEPYGTVTIQNGERTITFTEMPTAVLTCNTCATENMCMLGLQDYLVGRNVPSNAADVPLPEYLALLEDVPTVERSHENAVATGCDLVIGQVSVFRDTSWGAYEAFEAKDINCYTITGTIVLDETIENIYEDLRNLGRIFKVEDRAEAVIAEMQARIDAVQAAVAGLTDAERLTVFVMDSFTGNEIYTTSSGLQSNLIELAGGINVTRGMADSRWFTTSVETVVATNPDVIIFNDYGAQSMEEKLAFINDNVALSDVPAVRNQRYIIIPLVSVMQDIRAASACETIAEQLYPDCFS